MKYTECLLIGMIVITCLTSGCRSFVNKYGTAPEIVERNENTIDVVLPKNAPAIWQHYLRYPADTEKKDKVTEHLGIDIIAEVGTPVIAPAKGRVIGSFFEPVYGNHIVIDHGKDEAGLEVNTRFYHLQKRLVRKGDTVVRGQQIGTLGRTGILAGGLPHLHYELAREVSPGRVEAMNPNVYWMDGAGVVTCFDKTKQWADQPFRTVYPVICKGVDWR